MPMFRSLFIGTFDSKTLVYMSSSLLNMWEYRFGWYGLLSYRSVEDALSTSVNTSLRILFISLDAFYYNMNFLL
ncbi:hypothetical protein HanRHA438_Chr13g0598201 [Helianthus annuus]|nr:hypothetical protein HanHA300_Chr13g0481891 [Helianthus annuus]KAJ0497674.1 hypothetical protein HanHA89_Chr13g0513911 [Helianthus annuus]KAJ0663679.1 hypothetical protein HanLR1_Chr13g0483791 [Helianthus annuus]KAJ0858172.1 hypothetical protein HanRHA438_Chr13g0598201 [Helianthus annuus]